MSVSQHEAVVVDDRYVAEWVDLLELLALVFPSGVEVDRYRFEGHVEDAHHQSLLVAVHGKDVVVNFDHHGVLDV